MNSRHGLLRCTLADARPLLISSIIAPILVVVTFGLLCTAAPSAAYAGPLHVPAPELPKPLTGTIICRGGPALVWEKPREIEDLTKAPSKAKRQVVGLIFQISRGPAGPQGLGLKQPSECGFVDKPWPIEYAPPLVYFDAASATFDVRSGASGVYSRRSSIQEYLTDINHFWSFNVVLKSFYFDAATHQRFDTKSSSALHVPILTEARNTPGSAKAKAISKDASAAQPASGSASAAREPASAVAAAAEPAAGAPTAPAPTGPAPTAAARTAPAPTAPAPAAAASTTAAATAAEPTRQTQPSVPAAASASVPANLYNADDRAIIIVGGKKMTAAEAKSPQPPAQSPQPPLSVSTSRVRGGANQVIQGTALPGTAAASQTAAKIEELVCRGGSALGFEKRGEKVTPSGNAALMAMHFGVAPVAADKFGRGLSHSTCAFVGRTWVQDDPPGVQFETRSRSSKERDIKRAQHGSSALAVGPDDAERMADELSIPVYLANPSHYWRFSVTKGWGYFLAGDHGFVKTTLATASSRSDVISKTSIARLHNVQVRPSIGGARFRFIARPEADPTIDLGKQPAVTGRDGLKVLANPITMRAERDVMGGSNAAVNWYAAGTDAQRIKLERNTEYHYLITVPGNGAVPIQQHSGKLTTLQKVLKVTFKSVHILDDSDDLSDGEGAFTYCANGDEHVQEVSNFATGTDVPVNREFVFDRWEDGPLKIEVEGIDDDAEGRLLRGGCSLSAPSRNESADKNVARVQIDTTSPHLAGRRGATGFRIESLPRPRSDWLAFNVLVEVEILRPSN